MIDCPPWKVLTVWIWNSNRHSSQSRDWIWGTWQPACIYGHLQDPAVTRLFIKFLPETFCWTKGSFNHGGIHLMTTAFTLCLLCSLYVSPYVIKPGLIISVPQVMTVTTNNGNSRLHDCCKSRTTCNCMTNKVETKTQR